MVEHETQPWLKKDFGGGPETRLNEVPVPMPPPAALPPPPPPSMPPPPPPTGTRAPPQPAMRPQQHDILCVSEGCRTCINLRGPIPERSRAPRCECTECEDLDGMKEKYCNTMFSDYYDINPTETKELSEHQYLLCDSHLFAFILKDRTHGKIFCT